MFVTLSIAMKFTYVELKSSVHMHCVLHTHFYAFSTKCIIAGAFFKLMTHCDSVVPLSVSSYVTFCVLSYEYGTISVGSWQPWSADLFLCRKATANC